MKVLNFEVNYGFVVIVIWGRDFDEYIEWNGFIKDIDEVNRCCSDNPGDVLNGMIEFVNENYLEFVDKSPEVYERELYGCGPSDVRNYVDF
ncbi:MAG: hypothetical protein HC836_33825 [Richelia sp. RM2_1_2]|nr:hypothetical protein [Richelia sp. RM2_1_2]